MQDTECGLWRYYGICEGLSPDLWTYIYSRIKKIIDYINLKKIEIEE